jgi:hypothetical protein
MSTFSASVPQYHPPSASLGLQWVATNVHALTNHGRASGSIIVPYVPLSEVFLRDPDPGPRNKPDPARLPVDSSRSVAASSPGADTFPSHWDLPPS